MKAFHEVEKRMEGSRNFMVSNNLGDRLFVYCYYGVTKKLNFVCLAPEEKGQKGK